MLHRYVYHNFTMNKKESRCLTLLIHHANALYKVVLYIAKLLLLSLQLLKLKSYKQVLIVLELKQ